MHESCHTVSLEAGAGYDWRGCTGWNTGNEPNSDDVAFPELTVLRVLFHTGSPFFADLMASVRSMPQYADTKQACMCLLIRKLLKREGRTEDPAHPSERHADLEIGAKCLDESWQPRSRAYLRFHDWLPLRRGVSTRR